MAITRQIASKRFKAVITVTAGTPIFVAAGCSPILASRLIIQMLAGGGGRGLVYDDVPLNPDGSPVYTPLQLNGGSDIPVQLRAADADNPGGDYTDADTGGIDLRQIAVDGVNTGDTILVDARLRA